MELLNMIVLNSLEQNNISYRLVSPIDSHQEKGLGDEQADAEVLMDGVAITLEAAEEAEGEEADEEAHQRQQDAHPGNDIQKHVMYGVCVLQKSNKWKFTSYHTCLILITAPRTNCREQKSRHPQRSKKKKTSQKDCLSIPTTSTKLLFLLFWGWRAASTQASNKPQHSVTQVANMTHELVSLNPSKTPPVVSFWSGNKVSSPKGHRCLGPAQQEYNQTTTRSITFTVAFR